MKGRGENAIRAAEEQSGGVEPRCDSCELGLSGRDPADERPSVAAQAKCPGQPPQLEQSGGGAQVLGETVPAALWRGPHTALEIPVDQLASRAGQVVVMQRQYHRGACPLSQFHDSEAEVCQVVHVNHIRAFLGQNGGDGCVCLWI
jgi:hypothetical protein